MLIYHILLILFLLPRDFVEPQRSVRTRQSSRARWGSWSSWGRCTKSCGSGEQSRRRKCVYGCSTKEDKESRRCKLPSCASSTVSSRELFTKWSSFSRCSEQCGGGTQTRTRRCLVRSCRGSTKDTNKCNTAPCAKRGFTDWGTFSRCTATCGGGTQTRYRKCLDRSCHGSTKDTNKCNTSPCRRGFTDWGTFSRCTVTCGGGTQIRTRKCLDRSCHGSTRDTNKCNTTPCATPSWGRWSSWSTCQSSCGPGKKTRKRSCLLNGKPITSRGFLFVSSSRTGGCSTRQGGDTDTGTCNSKPCAYWGRWASWSACQPSCGQGRQTRKRSCIVDGKPVVDRRPSFFSSSRTGACSHLPGSDSDSQTCHSKSCHSWKQWSPWSKCSVSCGNGKMTRSRSCVNERGAVVTPSNCKGIDQYSERDGKSCSMGQCAYWSKWTRWSACKPSCGYGEKTRTRSCMLDGRLVLNRGSIFGSSRGCSNLPGKNDETQKCVSKACYSWKHWSPWSKCSVTCGKGKMTRTRSCVNERGAVDAPSNCKGIDSYSDRDERSCTVDRCAYWGKWTPWSACRPSCGHGDQTRTRSCMLDGRPTLDRACWNLPGDNRESRKCFSKACFSWRNWSHWSKCSVTCGTGKTSRTRTCVNERNTVVAPSNCRGIDKYSDREEKNCYLGQCVSWGDWSPWSACRPSCGAGKRTRTRPCIVDGKTALEHNPFSRSGACDKLPGSDRESRECNSKSCYSWKHWSPWSRCSVTCGKGKKTRTRVCVNENGHVVNPSMCRGIDRYLNQQEEDCFLHDCVTYESWGHWRSWSACKPSCGPGKRTRTRPCLLNGIPMMDHRTNGCSELEGDDSETQDCNSKSCLSWREWSNWSLCSVTCGNGERTRSRVCIDEMHQEVYPTNCRGIDMKSDQDHEDCYLGSCDNLTPWSSWTECSVTCGKGEMFRTKECVNEKGEPVSSWDHCGIPTHDLTENQPCLKPCYELTWWSAWSECICKDGTKERSRSCRSDNGEDGFPPELCDAIDSDLTDTIQCTCVESDCDDGASWCPDNTKHCHASAVGRICAKSCGLCDDFGIWSHWDWWGECDVTCGGGNQVRSRTCSNTNCEGPSREERPCGVVICPPVLGEWKEWAECSVTCGEGFQERIRHCLHGVCDPTDLSEVRHCIRPPCEAFGPWTDWNHCPTTCGNGLQQRMRLCIWGDCDPSELTETRHCSEPCKEFGLWSEWTDCSVSCGDGTKERYRHCEEGFCEFTELTDLSECTFSVCTRSGGFFWTQHDGPQDCQWGAWVGATCVQHGNDDYRIQRTREKEEATDGGKECEGPSTVEIPCKISSFIASTFLRMLGQQRNQIPESPTPESTTAAPTDSSQSDENPCLSTHRDRDGRIRMLGNRCTRAEITSGGNSAAGHSRRKRSVDGPKHRDILFLVDESGSVGEDNFKLEMAFAQATIALFCGNTIRMGQELTRVALVTFDKEIHVHVDFDHYFERAQMLGKMDQISYNKTTQGRTCLTKTLNFTQTDMFTPAHGARNDADKLIILVTDGCANCDKEIFGALNAVADALRYSEITILTFLINSSEDCMRKIEDPLTDGSHCYQIFAENWEELNETIKEIENAPCLMNWVGLSEETCTEN